MTRPVRAPLLLTLLFAWHVHAETETAVFAGGCFWCMEEAFEKVDGVVEAVSGYAGGEVVNPTYRQVSSGSTGHTEVVQVQYDPEQVSYADLLQIFWLNIDPTVRNRQFCDTGSQYRTAIFHAGDEQRELALASLAALKENAPFAGEIHTEIEPLDKFYPAEAYHQDYYQTNTLRYRSYKFACGREQRLDALWGDAERAY